MSPKVQFTSKNPKRREVLELVRIYKGKGNPNRWRDKLPKGQGDTGCITFDLVLIKEFLEQIDAHNSKNPVGSDNQIDQIRIYLCEYDKATKPKDNYEGNATVALVAFKSKMRAEEIDDSKGTEEQQILGLLLTESTNVPGVNMGTLCPPDCNDDKSTIACDAGYCQ